MQFLRDCQVIVGNANSALGLKDLRIQFEIKKSNISYPNLGKITIYNLKQQTRAVIKNEFTQILVNAGYIGQMQLIFKGDIKNVYHRIDGVDTLTEIYAGDGDAAWQTGTINITFNAGVPVATMVTQIAQTMTNVTVGALMGLDTSRIQSRAYTFCGTSREAMDELAATYSFDWAIQNGILETWAKNGSVVSNTTATVVSSQTGMIGSPTVTEIGANVTTLLNPSLLPNRYISIQAAGSDVSLGNPYFRIANKATIAQGFYIINTVTHTFDNRGEDALSEIEAKAPGVL